MTAILRLLIIVPVGFVAACMAAGAFLLLALSGGPGGWDEFASGTDGLFLIFGGVAGVVVAAFVAVPAFVVILLAELFAWRSLFFYLGVGALIGFSGSALPLQDVMPEADADALALTAAGLVGGSVYWLIAGRNAGVVRPQQPVATERPPSAPKRPDTPDS